MSHLIERTFPLPLAGVEAIDAWFDGVAKNQTFIRNLVGFAANSRIQVLEIEGICYFSQMTEETWESTNSKAALLLSSGTTENWSEEYARSLVHGLLPDHSREFATLLWEKASRLCHYSARHDGSLVLVSYGRGLNQLVKAILVESSNPMHYTEIADQASLRRGESTDVKQVHNCCCKCGLPIRSRDLRSRSAFAHIGRANVSN